MADQRAGYVVVDIWRVKPGQEEAIKAVHAEAWHQFTSQPGVISVDYSLLEGDPGRYLVIFRYADAATREAFVNSELNRSVSARLREFWELESPIYKGVVVQPLPAGS